MLHRAFAPVVTGKKVELLDPKTSVTVERGLNQLVSLVKREGGEKITHAQNEHDGVSNALAGGVLLSIKPPSAADVTAVTRTTAQKRQEYFESRSNPRGMTAAQVADATGIHWVTATSGERVQYRDLRGL